jgi:putative hydrolase of the HAD superfamily
MYPPTSGDGDDAAMTTSASPFEALVFDLGGVIAPHDNEFLHRRLLSRCMAPGASARLRVLAHDARFGNGERSIACLHQQLVREVGYSGDWSVFVGDWSCHLSIDPSMLALVERLSARNRVIIFSNTNQEHWDHVVNLSGGGLARFEAYLSHEIGQLKPSVQSFRTVAAKAGVTPARCFFVDDRADNVEAARVAGFQAEVFTGQAALTDWLTAAGVDTAG